MELDCERVGFIHEFYERAFVKSCCTVSGVGCVGLFWVRLSGQRSFYLVLTCGLHKGYHCNVNHTLYVFEAL